MRKDLGRIVRAPLVKGTLRCQLCSRPVGDFVGYVNRPLKDARFIPIRAGALPASVKGELRCARCHGQLWLDDIEPLGRSVPIEEVGGLSFANVLARVPNHTGPSAT